MAQNLTPMKSNLWSSAATNGFLLALVTVIVTLFSTAFPMNVGINLLITIVKLVVTIGLLYYFMKSFGQEVDTYPYGTAFTYGFAVSFCSNIVIACYFWVHYTLLFPDAIEKALKGMQQALAQYPIDQASLDFVMNNLPVIMSVAPLILYTLFGLIFAAILANFAKKAELPFTDETEA